MNWSLLIVNAEATVSALIVAGVFGWITYTFWIHK
jgi:hypothetical protein